MYAKFLVFYQAIALFANDLLYKCFEGITYQYLYTVINSEDEFMPHLNGKLFIFDFSS